MSFFRVTEPDVADVAIPDLGITIAQNTTVVLSDQFSVDDLYLSADLEALIIGGDLTVEINYGTGYAAILAGDYTNRDTIAAYLNVYEITNENNNEDLVDGSDASTLHKHDSRYFTETELSGVGGAALLGIEDANFDYIPTPITTIQAFADAVDNMFGTAITLDGAYDNDSDGILDVDGSTKDLNFRSDNANDILISRTDTVDDQNALQFDVSADQLLLGSAAIGNLAKVDVKVLTNLIVDGDITFTGTITDTTVNELNVTNSSIIMRDGAITDANASLLVNRPVAGADAALLWNETADRWQAGIVGNEKTIALLEVNELVTGIWEFRGGATTDPSMYWTNKTAAATTNLGTAGQIPMEVINNTLAIYDKTRSKWLSVTRDNVVFTGRDNSNNKDEYARVGDFTSNQAGWKLLKGSTLVGVSIKTRTANSWVMEVRRNGSATVVASSSLSSVDNLLETNKNVDFAAGDEIQVYINGSSVDRPLISLVFAEKF